MPRNSNHSSKRTPPKRTSPPKVHIFCEGKNTEKDYFSALFQHHATERYLLEYHGPNGVAKSVANTAVKYARENNLIGRARSRLNSFEENDQVWAVFDRDDEQVSGYTEAKQICRSASLPYGYADPCFEHWINLHFSLCEITYDRHAAQRRTRELLRGYDPDRGKSADFSGLVANFEAARGHAETQLTRRIEEGTPEGHPSTNIHELFEEIIPKQEVKP